MLQERRVQTSQMSIRKGANTNDPDQQRIINARESTIRVLAPAGSGKTQTILTRVLKRVEEGVSPGSFLILTFDNSAVKSIVAKLQEKLEGSHLNLRCFRIQTLNSLGYKILRDHFPEDYRPIMPEARKRKVFQEIKAALRVKSFDHFCALPLRVSGQFYLEFFSLLKNELIDPRDLEPQRFADLMTANRQAKLFFEAGAALASVRKVIEAVGWLFKAYDLVLQRERLIDFDDQKLRAYFGLRTNPTVLRRLQSKYSEIIVDEFQDINRLDFALIRILAERSNLLITGDDDQAIYGFRNCSSNFIIDLEKHLNRKVASYALKVNYRNPANLVEHAVKLIGHNTRRIRKDPISELQRKAEISVAAAASAGMEAKLVVASIQKLRRRNPELSYREIAVLYRINSQSLPLQIAFNLNAIPYVVSDQDHILNNPQLERLLGCLKLKLSLREGTQPTPEDAALTLKSFFSGLDSATAERLEQLFEQRQNFYETINSSDILKILPQIKERRFAEFVRETVSAQSLTKTLSIISKRCQGLKGMIGRLDETQEEENPLAGLFDLAADFAEDTARFTSVIETTLERARQTRAEKAKEQGVALLTYFKAKGRQWNSVILTGCNEGIIPHKRAPLEDERRLFYVALTRASSNLLISYVNRNWQKTASPSRFLFEAGLLENE